MKQMIILLMVAGLLLALPTTSPASVEPQANTCTVNSGADDADANPGDGVCATAGGNCTLHAAIQEANLDSGASTITFASHVDINYPSLPAQEPVLLYVTAKSATGFTVREVTLDGQPAECAFDYRIAAKRLGYEDVRLEEAT